jgi:hypothetical protein
MCLISSTMKSSMGGKIFDAMMKEKDLHAKKIFCSPLYLKHDGLT